MQSVTDIKQLLEDTGCAKAKFEAWHVLLEKWNKTINLVSEKAVKDFWLRHALDSWQLWPHIPETTHRILDLGSGAGFPGIAMAIGSAERGQGHVTMVESVGKKANFLKTVIRELDLPATVWAGRAERLEPEHYDIITARAFAPLPRLLTYAQPFWGETTKALLLKGESVERELTLAQEYWNYHVVKYDSVTEPNGKILEIRHLSTRS